MYAIDYAQLQSTRPELSDHTHEVRITDVDTDAIVRRYYANSAAVARETGQLVVNALTAQGKEATNYCAPPGERKGKKAETLTADIAGL